CIIVYGAYLYFSPRGLAGEEVWRELFFLQNYGMKGFLGIDWSLAVEEHFYLIFGLLAAWLGRPRAYGARDLARWRCVPWLAAALVVACLMLRIYNTPINWSATHNRIDALFVGAAMGWFYNVHRERFIRVFRPLPWLAAVVFVLAAVPAAMPDAVAGVWFIDTWYLVILTLAMVPLLGASLVVEAVPDRWLWRASAFVGRHSYCIYLFHVLFLKLSSKAWSVLHWYPPFWLAIVWGLAGSIAVGVAITRLVEVPVLRFRDLVSPRPVKHFLSPASASAVGGTHDTVPVTEGATPGLEMQNG
ncbi:MAG: hypothetical protein JWO94_3042, partial [Verrucomicrobiaceae bacterium]|nr:hypothetical protein [Verrucomicrobiaceae bacterium]